MKTYNRLFHMEQKLVALCVASVVLTGGAELLYGKTISENSPAPIRKKSDEAIAPIILATENTEAARLTNLGLQDVLLGYDSRARAYFNEVLTMEDSALALCGLMLLEQHNRADYSQQLKKLTDIINSENFFATPQEMFYVETFLKLISGDVHGAATDFAERAQLYRRDILAGCWSVSLLHSLQQSTAAAQARELYEKHETNPLCQFVYCLSYTTVPQEVPQEIIKLAKQCTDAFNNNPIVLHVTGHLLFQNSMYREASDYFSQEIDMLRQDNLTECYEYYRASLYHAAAKHRIKPGTQGTITKRQFADGIVSPADVLYRWEVMSLSMRELLLRKQVPTANEVRQAFADYVPHETLADDDAAHEFGECLKCILQMRVLLNTKHREKAQEVLLKAEEHYNRMRDARTYFQQKSVSYLIAFERALDCAETALHFGRSLMYKDSCSMWNDKVNQALQRQNQSRMLPPMLFRKSD